MRVLIFDTDCRYNEIITFFQNKKYEIDLTSNLSTNIDTNLYDIIVLPFMGINEKDTNKDFFKNIKPNTLLFSGIKTNYLEQELNKNNLKCLYFMNDPFYIQENSYITCEGIIADIIINTKISIRGANILVIGYGNIGKKLVKILEFLNANTSVGVIEENDFKELKKQNITCSYTNKSKFNLLLKEADIIINTVPKHVVNKNLLSQLKKEIYILDIASKPYGFDKNNIEEHEINYKVYPKIPSQIAPKTSGKILSKKINSFLGE